MSHWSRIPDVHVLAVEELTGINRAVLRPDLYGDTPATSGPGRRADPGLDQAIRAAGGVNALARKLGISHGAVGSWSRVPDDRVLEVEELTGINRAVLRPDLYVG